MVAVSASAGKDGVRIRAVRGGKFSVGLISETFFRRVPQTPRGGSEIRIVQLCNKEILVVELDGDRMGIQ